jgi:hypothetical protein
MEQIEYFGSKEEMREHFEGTKNRVEDVKNEFREKYEKLINCDSLFQDIKNMYEKDKRARSILPLRDREEYKIVEQSDFYNLVSAFMLRLEQLPDERKEYTYKKETPETTNDQK